MAWYRVKYVWSHEWLVEADSEREAYRRVDVDIQCADDAEYADLMLFESTECEQTDEDPSLWPDGDVLTNDDYMDDGEEEE